MRGLYKEKYLIAIYDNKDNIINVGGIPRDIYNDCDSQEYNSLYIRIKRILEQKYEKQNKGTKVFLIDCFEEHEDIFNYEDKEFLKFMEEEQYKYKGRTN